MARITHATQIPPAATSILIAPPLVLRERHKTTKPARGAMDREYYSLLKFVQA
jgi:hypothetical protein